MLIKSTLTNKTNPMESTMKTLYYIGIDFHPYQQTIAFIEDGEGEIKYRQFWHSDKQAIKRFYQECAEGSQIGVEATGSLLWFEKMLFEMGLRLRVGNPRLIRRRALSRHKNDYRDAETILDLLINEEFPEVEPKTEKSQLMLQLLNYRHSLIGKRTSVANQMQAYARAKGIGKFATKTRIAKQKLKSVIAENAPEELLLGSRWRIFESLTEEIKQIEAELNGEAVEDERVKLLMTHSGIGALTALALVHTLGDVRRFARKEQVVAFVGLDPLDKSSGDKKRIGKVSKHGSRLLRFLLGQAAQSTRDKGLKQFYERVSRRRGKPKAKVATARKLLINCYIMLRDEIDYEEFSRRGEVGLCGCSE